MNLAPLATILGTMLLGFPLVPLGITQHFHAGIIDQQMQAIWIRAIGNANLQTLLATT